MSMSEVENWNKLINVCYRAGYAGDFFCNLLYKNYNSDHDFVGNNINRYTYAFPNYRFTKADLRLKNIDAYAYLHKLTKNHDFVKRWSKDMREDLLKIYDIIYDKDFEIYIQNLVYYFKDVYLSTYSKEKINISHLHHYYPIEGFNLNDIFPGSTNILLTTENIIYHKRFLLFSFIKNFNNFNNKNINTIKESYENTLSKNYIKYDTFNDMHGIDIGKLIFEPDSTIQIENKLSNILQRKIILDRQKLNHYREKSLEQLQFWEEKGIMIYE
jgi:hypothetical protein